MAGSNQDKYVEENKRGWGGAGHTRIYSQACTCLGQPKHFRQGALHETEKVVRRMLVDQTAQILKLYHGAVERFISSGEQKD